MRKGIVIFTIDTETGEKTAHIDSMFEEDCSTYEKARQKARVLFSGCKHTHVYDCVVCDSFIISGYHRLSSKLEPFE